MTKRTRRKPKLNPLVIERQDVIQEIRTASPEMVRLSRVKYEGNDYTFVDIRRFWRGYDDDGHEVFYPSAKGLQMKEEDFVSLIEPYLRQAWTSMKRDSSEIH